LRNFKPQRHKEDEEERDDEGKKKGNSFSFPQIIFFLALSSSSFLLCVSVPLWFRICRPGLVGGFHA
jgi:hypothetical protein